jgi:GDP-4-dehydro-6-deoxy-D-mannose reductase
VKVLVTGANGFVGHRLVRRLLDAGIEVDAGYGVGAPGGEPPRDRRARWIELDVTNPATVATFVRGACDALVHLAGMALVRQANADPVGAWAVNAVGTAHVAHALAHARRDSGADPLLIVVSSAEVYEPRADRPYGETDPVGPRTPYAASKLGGEFAALSLWRSMALRVLVVRPFPHVGPGQAPGFWVARRSRALLEAKRSGASSIPVGDLSPIRDFLHVDDVVDAYVALLTEGRPGETYNVASGRAVTLGQVQAILEDLIGVHPAHTQHTDDVRHDARAYLVGDASKLRAATGWMPRRSLEDTLKEVVDAQAN